VVGQIVVERWRFIAVSRPPRHVTDDSCVFEPPQTVRGLSERWWVGMHYLHTQHDPLTGPYIGTVNTC